MKPDQILASLSELDNQKRPVTLVAIVFFSLVCLSLSGMQGWSVYKARDVQLKAATLATATMTQALSDHVSGGFELADTILLDLVDRVRLQQASGALESLVPYMDQRTRRTRLLHGLSLHDEAGALVAGTGPAAAPLRTPASQLNYHKLQRGPGLFFGVPFKNPADASWLLPLSRRLLKPDGTFGGIARVTVRLELFQNFYKDFEIGSDGAILVALDSGALVLAHPKNEAQLGRDIRNSELFQVWRALGTAGSDVRQKGPRGNDVETLYSFRHLAAYPLLVGVSRSTDEILASWWDSAYLSTAGVSLLMLFQLWLGIRLYGQIALRDRLEKERRNLQKLLVNKSRSLRRQALKDALTGIANRRQFDARLNREFISAMEDGAPLALVMLDVDHFKKYNDRYGHPAGDECLKFVASCISGGRRRSEDLAVRMGGEEFAILLPNTGLRGAIAVAESIRKNVASQKLMHVPGSPHSVTISCGVHALFPVEGMSPTELIDAADRALYLAKTSGRNRIRAEGSMPPAGAKRLSLVMTK